MERVIEPRKVGRTGAGLTVFETKCEESGAYVEGAGLWEAIRAMKAHYAGHEVA